MIHLHTYRHRKGGYGWNIKEQGEILTTGSKIYADAESRDDRVKTLLEAITTGDFEIVNDT